MENNQCQWKKQHTMRNVGKTSKAQCEKEAIGKSIDGRQLCQHHLNRANNKILKHDNS